MYDGDVFEHRGHWFRVSFPRDDDQGAPWDREDRKSTRLNSSHVRISYAVFCLKKKIRHSRFADAAHSLHGRRVQRLLSDHAPPSVIYTLSLHDALPISPAPGFYEDFDPCMTATSSNTADTGSASASRATTTKARPGTGKIGRAHV